MKRRLFRPVNLLSKEMSAKTLILFSKIFIEHCIFGKIFRLHKLFETGAMEMDGRNLFYFILI